MIKLTNAGAARKGHSIYLNARSIESVAPSPDCEGSLVRMQSGDLFAVDEAAERIALVAANS